MSKKKDVRRRGARSGEDGKDKDGKRLVARRVETDEERKKREEDEDEEFEKQCEKYCSYIITLAMIASPLYGLMTFLGEYATRPTMLVDVADLSTPVQQAVVITGGCDGMGAELARMMVDSGASVTLGCRDMERAEDAVRRIQLGSKDPAGSLGTVTARQLDLESFESTREFALGYIEANDRLDILVLNAGTTAACNLTADGLEVGWQVNYLGHFLLAELLLPTIRSSRLSKQAGAGRVVSVSCPAAREGVLDLADVPPLVDDSGPLPPPPAAPRPRTPPLPDVRASSGGGGGRRSTAPGTMRRWRLCARLTLWCWPGLRQRRAQAAIRPSSMRTPSWPSCSSRLSLSGGCVRTRMAGPA